MGRQSAVDWLKKELEDYGSSSHLNLDWQTFDELCEQAKQLEKEQQERLIDETLTAYGIIKNSEITEKNG